MRNNDLVGLLDKEMDRKEFLRTLIIGCLAITGIGALTKALTAMTGRTSEPKTRANGTYGGSAYGR